MKDLRVTRRQKLVDLRVGEEPEDLIVRERGEELEDQRGGEAEEKWRDLRSRE